MCPITASRNSVTLRTESTSSISLEGLKHTLRRSFTANYRVNVSCADLNGVYNPVAIFTDLQYGLQRKLSCLFFQYKRALIQSRLPIALFVRIGPGQWASSNVMPSIHPTLFRSWQMRPIGRKRR